METIEIFIFCQFSMLFNDAMVLLNLIKQKSPCVLQDIAPFGAAAQKKEREKKSQNDIF